MTMTKSSATLLPLLLSAAGVQGQMPPSMTPEENAGNARWLLRAMPWGTLTNAEDPMATQDNGGFEIPDAAPTATDAASLYANYVPFGTDKDTGRVFFYFQGHNDLPGATLTVSQGGVNPALFAVAGCGTSMDSVVDVQDPQCTKLSISGDSPHCGHHGRDADECTETGKAALFAAHPAMKDWPEDEYVVHELFPRDGGFWMINAYGGDSGKNMGGAQGFANVPEDMIVPHDIALGFTYEDAPAFAEETPPEDAVSRARWIAHQALYATVSTLDDAGAGHTFGNPRSITDGASLASSSGLPVFNVPDADATAGDMAASGMQVALTFAERQGFSRVNADGEPCNGGMCAEVVMYAKAVPLVANSTEWVAALADFKATHPMAEWLWKGGSHQTSKYYSLEPTRILLRDSPEKAAQSIDVTEYLGVEFSGDGAEEVKVHKLVPNEEDAGLGEEEPGDDSAASWPSSAMHVIASLIVFGAIAF